MSATASSKELLMNIVWQLFARIIIWFRSQTARPMSSLVSRPAASTSGPNAPITILGPKQRERLAAREAGYALVAWHTSYITDLTKVTLDETSSQTIYQENPDNSARYFWSHLTIILARAAAGAFFEGKSNYVDSKQDLLFARTTCAALLARYPDTVCPWQDVPRKNFRTGQAFDGGVTAREEGILNRCYDQAFAIIKARQAHFEMITQDLLSRGELSSTDLERILGDRSKIIVHGLLRPGLITLNP